MSEGDNLTSPRATADARPRTARHRRLGHERRPALDSVSGSDRVASFEQRFPHAAAVEVRGRR